jgi:hypothetical protein
MNTIPVGKSNPDATGSNISPLSIILTSLYDLGFLAWIEEK